MDDPTWVVAKSYSFGSPDPQLTVAGKEEKKMNKE